MARYDSTWRTGGREREGRGARWRGVRNEGGRRLLLPCNHPLPQSGFITAQGFARGGASKWRREITGDGRRPASPRPENLGYSRVISSGQSQSQGTSGSPVWHHREMALDSTPRWRGGHARLLGRPRAISRPISPNLAQSRPPRLRVVRQREEEACEGDVAAPRQRRHLLAAPTQKNYTKKLVEKRTRRRVGGASCLRHQRPSDSGILPSPRSNSAPAWGEGESAATHTTGVLGGSGR